MHQAKKSLRVLAWVIAGLCGLLIALAVTIHIDEYLLRRNAERFLADLKSLDMWKSTFNDARLVIDRWKDNSHTRGPCQPERCDVEIGIADFFDHHWAFFTAHPRLQQVWRVLGGRPALIDGYIRVQKNIVWGKGVRAVVLSYSAEYKQDVDLIGRMESVPPSHVSLLHPEYEVATRRTTKSFALGARADFTPYADAADVRRLMDINFSCLTSWHACQTAADIAPTAWSQATAEENKWRAARSSPELTCNPAVVRVLARESRRAVIGEVKSIRPSFSMYDDSSFAEVRLLLKDDLKPCNFDFLLKLRDYSFSESPSVKRNLGDRYLLFFRYPDGLYSDNDHACDRLPATKENMEAVRQGIAEVWTDQND